ncbi:hypothetical protein Agub_g12066 [Astrephomene gubernaculifera]|uniref:Uncharacterized protein n=1 Tax=Astrephomene gubernaculifera TaxID=47775 RepID=A0AAD3E0E6_9CHLO|nr:hypothetical protein Agub_g12066 [Astrephomene gubernaculifera]
MPSLIHRPCSASARPSSRGCAVGSRLALPHNALIAAPRYSLAPCSALRREIQPVSFGDIYLAMQERVATKGTMPKADGRLMVESIRSAEHGQRSLELIAQHVAAKRQLPGALELDWPTRKKWLARICELALRLPNCKPLILDIFANAEAFGLSTYFAAEMVELLAGLGAEVRLLVRLVELFRARRLPGDKGVAAAYHRLLAVMRERKDEVAAQAASAALKAYLAAPAPPVPGVPQVPGVAGPVGVVGAQQPPSPGVPAQAVPPGGAGAGAATGQAAATAPSVVQ